MVLVSAATPQSLWESAAHVLKADQVTVISMCEVKVESDFVKL